MLLRTIVIAVLWIHGILGQSGVVIDPALRTFFGTLEPYVSGKNDIVFVLDASGSIGRNNFKHEIKFTELVSRMFTVASDFTRVSVISYSNVIKTPIDYIKNSGNNNMCTFLKDLASVPYTGRNTNTAGALKQSGAILINARPKASKIVLLISDGKSSKNYGSPIPIAQNLKKSGYIVFCIGVASINKEELDLIATSPNHVYMLQNFQYIISVNDQLRNDTKELVWDAAEPELCNTYCSAGQDCCDANAACFCGTRGGRYECTCKAGYQGNGHQGECKKCPFGTYKESSGKGLCIACPKFSSTLQEGSTSVTQCVCNTGHEGKPEEGEPCQPITCSKLYSPVGGQIFPANCGNQYNDECTFGCHNGYCPYSCNNTNSVPKKIEFRKCSESRVWSGSEFYCDKIVCPSMDVPVNGKYKCNSTDFGFHTQCNFTCNVGFALFGSSQRSCLLNGQWTGSKTICKVIKCPSLKINNNLKVKPNHCSTKAKPFRTTCQYFCSAGYELQTPLGQNINIGIRECLANGSWSNFNEAITCKDITPPTITCPSDLVVNTDKLKPTALVKWKRPIATDNSWIKDVRMIYPIGIKELIHHFPIGKTKVSYKAIDGVGLYTICSFTITVNDLEPPRVENCPSDIEMFYHKRSGTPVMWIEPTFVDNSGKIKNSFRNREPGQEFAWGPAAEVVYNATDYSQNSALCKFKIKVKQYKCPYNPPPVHGSLTCDKWIEGQFCSVACRDGYEFIREPEKVYYCKQNVGFGEWGSLLYGTPNFEFPWPDCARKKAVSAVQLALKSQYYVGSCPKSPEARQAIAKNFINILKDEFFILGICVDADGCTIKNVNITCGSTPASSSGRSKRSIQSILAFNYDVLLKPNVTLNATSDSANSSLNVINNFVNNTINEIKSNGPVTLPNLQEYGVNGVDAIPNGISVSEEPKLICESGSILVNNICLNCPEGSYHNEESDLCIDCPLGYYQNQTGASLCLMCPSSKTTLNKNSKSIGECKHLCPPGTYSYTGYESCSACPIGTYQHQSGSMSCISCAPELTTWSVGSYSPKNCSKPCAEGTISDTGFHPCDPCPRGTYQNETKATKCMACEDGLTTLKEGAHIKQLCLAIDLCLSLEPCINGASCVNNGIEYSCLCKPGFIGKNCEINEDNCFSGSCLNNATCIDKINDFYCWCSAGFEGRNCENEINECLPNPCGNGGSCIDKFLGFQCLCPNGFSGNRCEVDLDECSSNPCQNGGMCTDLKNDYYCCCPVGYTGKSCENIINPCNGIDCKNGASCIANGTDRYHCTCPAGYSGTHCESDVDDCASHLCKNYLRCVDGVNSYMCICKPGYNGTFCDEAIPSDFDLSFTGGYSSNYVKIKMLEDLDALTVLFWMKTTDSTTRGTPVSYSYQAPDGSIQENALTFSDYNKFIVALHGSSIRTEIIGNKDSLWHSYVLTWDRTNGSWAIFQDGMIKHYGDGIAKNQKLWSGFFVLAQEQDSLGGTFSPTEAFIGSLSQFNVWNYAMTSEEVKLISKKCNFYGNIIAWPNVLLHLSGTIEIVKPSKVCTGNNKCSENDCHCSLSKSDDTCWRDVKSCTPNPCFGGTRCSSLSSGSKVCTCRDGLYGKFCQFDVDECKRDDVKCSHSCENLHGSYRCTCPKNLIIGNDSRTCMDPTFCKFNDVNYLAGKSWNHGCERCKCNAGVVICAPLKCPSLSCSKDEKMIQFPGNCCPKCAKAPKTCSVSKENKFNTFDGMNYWFVGNCRYVFAKDCSKSSSSFEVAIEFGTKNQAKKSLHISADCHRIKIDSTSNVVVNGLKVKVPHYEESFMLSQRNNSLMVHFHNEIIVEYTNSHSVFIHSPSTLKNKLCGLCGNYNDVKTDDKITRQSLPARTMLEFSLSWKVKGNKHCKPDKKKKFHLAYYPHLQMMGACKYLPLLVQIRAQKMCSILKSFTFKNCYSKVNPTQYFSQCLQDACTCGFNEPCFCDAVSSYVQACRSHNVELKGWNDNICSLKCSGGMVYDECGPSCPETCDTVKYKNRNCPSVKCIPGCFCPAGFVIHQNRCIRREHCFS